MSPVSGFESAAPAAASAPEAATDVIKWLPVLCEPRFAAERARVEAPYRRDPTGRTNPTTADYQNMIDAAGQMKAVLGRMTAEISAQDYLNAEKFLDQLAAEARGRIENRPLAPCGGLHCSQPRAHSSKHTDLFGEWRPRRCGRHFSRQPRRQVAVALGDETDARIGV